MLVGMVPDMNLTQVVEDAAASSTAASMEAKLRAVRPFRRPPWRLRCR